MSVRHLFGREDVYIIESNADGSLRRSIHWPKGEASIEASRRYSFGPGIRVGRNGDESDIGVDLYGSVLGSVWLRLRSPWTRWARIEGDYDPRHYGFQITPHDAAVFSADWGKRNWYLAWWKIWGRVSHERTTDEIGVCEVPLPEGVYHATWKRETITARHVRWPGTWRDKITPKHPRSDVWLDVPGGIPVEGKGENSWDCGMDGVFGTGGETVERAIGNTVAAVLRGRNRYGGPHNLPRPMTVSEAGSAQ